MNAIAQCMKNLFLNIDLQEATIYLYSLPKFQYDWSINKRNEISLLFWFFIQNKLVENQYRIYGSRKISESTFARFLLESHPRSEICEQQK